MIELRNLNKTFQNIRAADHVNTVIQNGMVYGLIGSNGAGKSTLLRMISGILKPDSGEILLDGKIIFENPEVKSQICFLSDTPYFFPNADPAQMREYYALAYPATFDRNLFDSMIKKFGLDPSRKIRTFSKGMKKQLSLLLGLSARIRYLLCDETFDGLDPVMRQAIKSLLASEILNRDFTPVISSHNLRELEDICDTVGLLHNGKILFTRELDQMKYNLCKLQCVIRDPAREMQLIRNLKVLRQERSGSLLTLTVRGKREDVLAMAEAESPLFAEVLPLTLEEIFINETEVAGYDVRDFIY